MSKSIIYQTKKSRSSKKTVSFSRLVEKTLISSTGQTNEEQFGPVPEKNPKGLSSRVARNKESHLARDSNPLTPARNCLLSYYRTLVTP